MHFLSSSAASLFVLLGGSALVSAASVCSGNQFAIGTASVNSATDATTYKVYTASTCAISQTLTVSTTYPCDNKYFFCNFGSTTYQEYDDPSTGISYLCAADPTASESCGGDVVTYCCHYGSVPQ